MTHWLWLMRYFLYKSVTHLAKAVLQATNIQVIFDIFRNNV